jgi:hypothetical protein
MNIINFLNFHNLMKEGYETIDSSLQRHGKI